MRRDEIDRLLAFFFRPQGRIGRAEFALGMGFIVALDMATLVWLWPQDEAPAGTLTTLIILGLPLLVAQFVLVAKRGHDLGLPGIFVLLLAVPLVGLGWLVLLALMPGSPRPNMYGPPPQFRPD
jgi:uncharacterized membrane protein YhaH (DUF805 family)